MSESTGADLTDANNATKATFGTHTSLKQVTIVDEDIDVFDDRDVEWAVATRFQADRGLVVLHGVRGSSIDPTPRRLRVKGRHRRDEAPRCGRGDVGEGDGVTSPRGIRRRLVRRPNRHTTPYPRPPTLVLRPKRDARP